MTEKHQYVCDKCGTAYATPEACQTCESGHVPAVRIRSQKYVAITADQTGYPTYVSLVMGDGRIVRFRRC